MVSIFVPDKLSPQKIRQAAEEDGKNGIPGAHATDVSAFERTLVDKCEQVLREYEGKYEVSEAELRQQFLAVRDDYRRAKRLYDAKHAKLERPVMKHVPIWAYILSLIAIVIVELPVNQAALNILGDAPILTITMAVLLGVVFMIVAHLIGMTARHRGFHAGSIFAILLVIGIISGLAYLRVKFFMNPEEGETLLKALQEVDTRALAALFALMNVLFVVVAIWLSYFAHDADEYYSKMYKDYLSRRGVALKVQEERAKRFAQFKAAARDYVEMTHGLINDYRRHNLASRENRAQPDAWLKNSPEQLLDISKYAFKLEHNELDEETAT